MKNRRCDICQMKLVEGARIRMTDYRQTRIPLLGWRVMRFPKRVYICSKCLNVGAALIRNHIAIKTQDLIDR